jgi:hypothetical protein
MAEERTLRVRVRLTNSQFRRDVASDQPHILKHFRDEFVAGRQLVPGLMVAHDDRANVSTYARD